VKYQLHSHRNGLFLFENEPTFRRDWLSIREVLDSITDADLIAAHRSARAKRRGCKSLSDAINGLLRARLDSDIWDAESAIFNHPEYARRRETRWRLDFASQTMAVEVAFNHGEAIAWNLLKPALSGELNHVEKKIQTSGGVVITATKALKAAGNFDGAVGEYEKFLRYLPPMMNVLTVPMVVIGLEAPETFSIGAKGSLRGEVIPLTRAHPNDSQLPLAAEDSKDYG